jgi:general secretion pathway protein A
MPDTPTSSGYEQFFGLNEPPFNLTPNPRFVFESTSHSTALAQLTYAIERREPVVVITGEIGAGKTLLCRTVLERIKRKTFLSIIDDPLLDRDDLLKQMLQDFGVISSDRSQVGQASRHDLFRTLQAFLTSLAPLQAHAVVIIDEAQHLQPDVLEQIRLLSNISDERGTLLQIILVGQMDLEPLLARPELRQLQQRVTRPFRLEPLKTDEVRRYIEHRLFVACGGSGRGVNAEASDLEREVAGWAGPKARVAFTPDAIGAVSKLSGGLPRVINIVCDRALEEAHERQLHRIDVQVINTAASALGLTPKPSEIEKAPAAAPPPAAAPASEAATAAPEAAKPPAAAALPAAVAAPSPAPAAAPAHADGTALREAAVRPESRVRAEPPPPQAIEPARTERPVERATAPKPAAPKRTRDSEEKPVAHAFRTLAQEESAAPSRTWIVLVALLVVLAAVLWFNL